MTLYIEYQWFIDINFLSTLLIVVQKSGNSMVIRYMSNENLKIILA